jgi:hypothetical protein
MVESHGLKVWQKQMMLLKKSLTESVQPRRRRNFNGIDRLYARRRGIEGGSPALEALLIGLSHCFSLRRSTGTTFSG